ncbi:hypothetical protein NEMIN01_2398 [Nematocida minor]|uniref:uncharacterized protein n=1 Tax=Nematocida minor TaxID=1912983 RepID=UPI0022208DDC|nr:uncharacterized protein NEMIN01_2398 [Nematocida minor]KAI5193070.1 hypothetical protein NEMIN01_2398 [Nematocida minor]
MREVKLKVDLDGMTRACRSFIHIPGMKKVIELNDDVCYLSILRHIFDGTMTIENVQDSGRETDQCTEKEREYILNTIKNNIYKHFVYDVDREGPMHWLYTVIKYGGDRLAEFKPICIMNEVIAPPNTFIYNPEHGIRRKHGMNEAVDNIEPDHESAGLGTREYTLEIDDTKFESLKSLFWFTAGNLEREFLYCRFNFELLSKISILKKFLADETFYTLDELYTKKHESANVALVDYGLNFILEKALEIRDLLEEAEEEESAYTISVQIIEKVSKVFTEEDLKIAISIFNNIEDIYFERQMHDQMIKTLEYMASKNMRLEEKNRMKTLMIKPDFSNFYEKYINKEGLKAEMMEERRELCRERSATFDSRTEAKKIREKLQKKKNIFTHISQRYIQTEEEKKALENIEQKVNYLDNKLHLLYWQIEREHLQHNNIRSEYPLSNLSEIKPVQRQYIFEKLQELGKVYGINVVADGDDRTDEIPKKRKFTLSALASQKSTVGKILSGTIVLAAVPTLFFIHHSKSNPMTAGINDSLYHVVDSSQLGNIGNPSIS